MGRIIQGRKRQAPTPWWDVQCEWTGYQVVCADEEEAQRVGLRAQAVLLANATGEIVLDGCRVALYTYQLAFPYRIAERLFGDRRDVSIVEFTDTNKNLRERIKRLQDWPDGTGFPHKKLR